VGESRGTAAFKKARTALVATLGILSLVTAVSTATPAAAASNIGVFVGYADSARADPANFPTPWFGSPQTIFEGCAPVAACVYDAGSIRVVLSLIHI